MPECRHETRNFSGNRRFRGIRELWSKAQEKNASQSNVLEFVLIDAIKNLNGKFNSKVNRIKAFFFQIKAVFMISKKEHGRPSHSLLSLVARL